MQYRQLGRSALKVSALGLGTMNFGPRTSEQESFDILNQAVDAGINFIDTANQNQNSRVGFGKVDATVNKDLADKFAIQGYPTILWMEREKSEKGCY